MIKTPYLLFLGDAPDALAAKVAPGIKDWRPEARLGQSRMGGCNAELGPEHLTLAQAPERFYTVNGSYSNDPVALRVAVAGDVTGGKYPTETGYYIISITGLGGAAFDGSGFDLVATPAGAQAADVCTSMTINHLGVKAGAGDKCW